MSYSIHIYEVDNLAFAVELYESDDEGLHLIDSVDGVNQDVAHTFMLATINGYNLERETKIFDYIIRDGYFVDVHTKTVGDYLDAVNEVSY